MVTFDPSALAALRAAVPEGSNLVERVVRAWLRDAPTRISEARVAAEQGRREEAHRVIHSLKSASATVGARRLAACCRVVERAFGTGAPDPELLEDIERELARRQLHLPSPLPQQWMLPASPTGIAPRMGEGRGE